jgi:hypothetical protein
LLQASDQSRFNSEQAVFSDRLLVGIASTPFDGELQLSTMGDLARFDVGLVGLAYLDPPYAPPNSARAVELCNFFAEKYARTDDFGGTAFFAFAEAMDVGSARFFVGNYLPKFALGLVPVFRGDPEDWGADHHVFVSRTSMSSTPFCLIGNGVGYLGTQRFEFSRSLFLGVNLGIDDITYGL